MNLPNFLTLLLMLMVPVVVVLFVQGRLSWALAFFLLEFSGGDWAGRTLGERVLASLFQSVTPRTAGFNTVDLTAMREASLTLMILLMLTGGSPGSTAGGMKTTTVAVLFLSAVSVCKRRETVRCFG